MIRALGIDSYNYRLYGSKFKALNLFIFGPLILGYLMNTSQGFFYISDSRFLFTRYDQGEFELHFLKAKNKKIVQWFCGSDIRSVVLSKSIQLKSDYETFADVIPLISPYVLTDEYDFKKKLIARVTDRYADLIFTNEIDQISYLMSPALNTSPIIGEEYFSFNPDKFIFSAGKKIQIVHIASNVFIKGTPLVMSAVNRLKKRDLILILIFIC